MKEISSSPRRVVFITGTRADFGKLKGLIEKLDGSKNFEIFVFVTGMHMLSKYGSTALEVEAANFNNIYKYINQSPSDSMDSVLAKTIGGLSDYVKEINPSLIVIHGDRVETLAAASVGALNNILVAHIEGGEVSGTVDELIRHAVTKLSHIHFVANEAAEKRLLQLGETGNSIYIIGSPDVDAMISGCLPTINDVFGRYSIDFSSYAILLFHPVTTELELLGENTQLLLEAVMSSGKNYIVIYPNNDHGTEIILDKYKRLKNNPKFKIFPSMRFEYFLTLLKNAEFIIGNSSAGIREAPHFGTPTINIGTRQQGRFKCNLIINSSFSKNLIIESIKEAGELERNAIQVFGDGNSVERFYQIVSAPNFWQKSTQKYFVDR